jgi:regulator of RNase E activity RraA
VRRNTLPPGDLVIADELGVTVVRLAEADTVLKAAREQAPREQAIREWVAKGKTVENLLKVQEGRFFRSAQRRALMIRA